MNNGTRLMRNAQILLVEDSPSDANLAIEAIQEGSSGYVVHHVEDGEDAIAFVLRKGRFQGVPRPDLVLLDLNLPGRSGLEVLAEIRKDANLRSLLVVVLSSSSDERDVLASYEHFANLYITKPVDFDAFRKTMQLLKVFCFNTIALPTAWLPVEANAADLIARSDSTGAAS